MSTAMPALRKLLSALILLCSGGNLLAHSPSSSVESGVGAAPNKMVVAGYIERAWLEGSAFSVKAKLDTGAKSSSLNAAGAVEFKKNGQTWVRFSVQNDTGDTHTIERPIVRIAHIRRAGAKISKRPVIKIKLCVAGQSAEVDVTLANRTGMNYRLLIGRSFLRSRILVDSSATFLSNATKCD